MKIKEYPNNEERKTPKTKSPIIRGSITSSDTKFRFKIEMDDEEDMSGNESDDSSLKLEERPKRREELKLALP
jgi:hypothetical protein